MPKGTLYDIGDEGIPGGLFLSKFNRAQPLFFYKGEDGSLYDPLFHTFGRAKVEILKNLRSKLDQLEREIEMIEDMNEGECPEMDDPYV